MPRVFPDGLLAEVPGSLALGVRARLLVFLLAVAFTPLFTVLGLIRAAATRAATGTSFAEVVPALTHASGADTRLASNERLEFLGDSVLGLVVCEQLYERFPEYQEGDLTKIKSAVVSLRACARISRDLNLGDFLFLGKGMHLHTVVPASLLADVFESLVAAIYLDSGF